MSGPLGALGLLLTFVMIGLSGWITPDYGYREWTAKELAGHGRTGMDCETHETVTLDHTMSPFDCVCYCPPDAVRGLVTLPRVGEFSCACP